MEKLGLNLSQLVWQIVAFGLLVFLLQRFLYKPILSMLDERRQRIEQGMRDAQKASEQAAAAQQEFERRIAEAKKEGQAILAQANEMGAKLREEILAESRAEAQRMIAKAKEEIEADRARAMAELESQVADLAVMISQRVIGATLDETAHRRLIGEFLAKTEDMK